MSSSYILQALARERSEELRRAADRAVVGSAAVPARSRQPHTAGMPRFRLRLHRTAPVRLGFALAVVVTCALSLAACGTGSTPHQGAGTRDLTVAAAAGQHRPVPHLSGRSDEHLRLTVPFNGGKQTHIDLGRHGFGPGDMFLSTGMPVRAHGKRIGTLDGVETLLSAAHHGIVSQQATLRLRGGNIMMDGIGRHDDHPFRLAVTGGTGTYSNVRGQLTVVREDDRRKINIVRLDLHGVPRARPSSYTTAAHRSLAAALRYGVAT
jgi:hypothetical protein